METMKRWDFVKAAGLAGVAALMPRFARRDRRAGGEQAECHSDDDR